ncbi:acyloxyacyl hydrolase [Candidatus Macondimonas diazotrophica]|nr:acyloxyacyl hydrolase [Candidatus Macondimonas diazotrophica]NCU01195.1 acyloxyacyl hydrolase [Candidatus Macondimonas diazotrophica]
MPRSLMKSNRFGLLLRLLLLSNPAVTLHAAPLYAVGVLAHDRGPFSDRHEDGVDLNVEIQFVPLSIIPYSVRPHLGTTLNFNGDTSAAYGGLSWRLYDTPRGFLDGIVSLAVHDGPLSKDKQGCKTRSDCGFGVRMLPRLGMEIGYRITSGRSMGLFYDHMSHKWVIGGENEGIDHIGLRYRQAF